MRLREADSEALGDDVGEETLQSAAGRGPAMSLPGFVRQPTSSCQSAIASA